MNQINKHSGPTVSYKPVKTSRAIADFAFKITETGSKPKHGMLTDQQLREQLEAKDQQRIDDPQRNFDAKTYRFN